MTDFEIALTSMFTSNGPTLAGRHGLGLLQLTGLTPEGMAILASHLETMESEAARAGAGVVTDGVRVVGIMHLSDTREQALIDVEFGISEYFAYAQDVLGAASAAGTTLESRREWAMTSGNALIGTPEDAIDKLGELVDASAGRVGAFLLWAQEWASPAATRHSYELFARHVMPVFQRTTARLAASRSSSVESRDRLGALGRAGIARFSQDEVERAARERMGRG